MVGGLLVLAPVYLAILLLLKAMSSLKALVRPIATLLPAWLPGEEIGSLLVVLIVCFIVGLSARTRHGRTALASIENSTFRRLPGYASIRGLAQQLAGHGQDEAWKPALAEIEEALVPAFIIEALPDGRSTVFVPSVPTPFAGSIYILSPERVHPVAIPLTQAIKALSSWGVGAKDLVAAMEQAPLGPARASARRL
ncbi:MAG TPA: hypothetical protein VJR47_03105 [Stellaceae bacterium]|nr:hypothetical protein [Stellaceae bacterium]